VRRWRWWLGNEAALGGRARRRWWPSEAVLGG
jgi:hypothetical protein